MKRFTIQQKMTVSVLAVCLIPMIMWIVFSSRTINEEMYAKEVNAAENALNQISMSMRDIITRSQDSVQQLIGDTEIADLISREKLERKMVSTVNLKLQPMLERLRAQNSALSSVRILHKNARLFDVYNALYYREDFGDIVAALSEPGRTSAVLRYGEGFAKCYRYAEWYVFGMGRSGVSIYGVAEAALDSDKLYAALDLYAPREGESLQLLDGSGASLYGEDTGLTESAYGEAPLKLAGVWDEPGEEYIVVSRPVPSMNATLIMRISRGLVRMSDKQITLLLLSAGVSVAGMLALAAIMSRLIFKRLARLAQRMDGIYADIMGNDPPEPTADEITHLERHFDDMILRIRKYVQLERQTAMKDLTNELKPHFICNVLDMLRLQTEQAQQNRLSQSIMKISQYFRYTVMMWQADTTLESELKEADNYIELVNEMRERKIGYRLEPDEWVELNAERAKIPRLILQPLIDNAIRHGLRGVEGPMLILRVGCDGEVLTIEVEDNGNGMSAEEAALARRALAGEAPVSDEHRHVGIRNVVMRVEMFNAERNVLDFVTSPGAGTRFTLKIRMR